MKKSIIIKIIVFISIIFIVVICATLYLSNKTNSIITDPGTRDYEYYYNYEHDYGCGYYGKKNSIYNIYSSIESPPIFCEMPTADKETFKVLDFLYTKDENSVFYFCEIIKNADAQTFEVVDSKEEDRCNMSTGFAKDKKYIYQYGKIMPGLDAPSFKRISSGCIIYLKDKNGIYNDSGEKINEADPETFGILKDAEPPNCNVLNYDSEDKNHRYKSGKIVN